LTWNSVAPGGVLHERVSDDPWLKEAPFDGAIKAEGAGGGEERGLTTREVRLFEPIRFSLRLLSLAEKVSPLPL